MMQRYAISDPYFIAALYAICVYVFYRGKIAAALGGFIACSSWMYNVDIGSLPMLRVFAATLVFTACVAGIRKPSLLGQCFRSPLILVSVWLVFGWILWIALGVVLAPSLDANLIFFLFETYTLVPIALMLLFINNIADIREMALSFVLSSSVAALGSLYLFSTKIGVAKDVIRGPGGLNYLTFSNCLSIAALLGLGLLLAAKRPVAKAAFLVLVGTCGVVLLMTGARQAVLGLLCALAYVGWIVLRQSKRVLGIFTVGVTFAGLTVAVFLYTDIGRNVLVPKWNTTSSAAQERQDYWRDAWKVFTEHPMTGGGLANNNGVHAHNLILDLLAAQGLIGFLFLAGFATLTLRGIRNRAFRTMPSEGQIWKTILISIIIFTAVHSNASGSVVAEPEFFWAPFLLIQLGSIAEQDSGAKQSLLSFTARRKSSLFGGARQTVG
jgi:O-antigen ligase